MGVASLEKWSRRVSSSQKRNSQRRRLLIHAQISGQLEGYIISLPASFICVLKDEARLRQTELSVSVSTDVATDCLAIISDAAQLFHFTHLSTC